jgi:hypothetical protein
MINGLLLWGDSLVALRSQLLREAFEAINTGDENIFDATWVLVSEVWPRNELPRYRTNRVREVLFYFRC